MGYEGGTHGKSEAYAMVSDAEQCGAGPFLNPRLAVGPLGPNRLHHPVFLASVRPKNGHGKRWGSMATVTFCITGCKAFTALGAAS